MKTKNIFTTFLFFAASFLVSANQSDNQLGNRDAQNDNRELAVKPFSDLTHYSFALDPSSPLESAPSANASSDEYWFQVSGSELNQGVTINTSQPNALIRITQGASKSTQQQSVELDTSLLQLVSESSHSAIEQIISPSQLAQTGVFDSTVILKTDAKTPAGKLTLKSTQSLFKDQTYLISVKEKNSPYRLELDLSSQNYLADSPAIAKASIEKYGDNLSPEQVKIWLISPLGEKSPLTFKHSKKNNVMINLQKPSQVIPPIQGLYELLVESTAKDSGLTIKRMAKLALAFSEKTAHIVKVDLDPLATFANVQLRVDHRSRFELRGILQATNSEGDLVPVMETHVAKTLSPGQNKLTIPFDAEILFNAKLSSPYRLTDLRLFDQTQLALIESHQ